MMPLGQMEGTQLRLVSGTGISRWDPEEGPNREADRERSPVLVPAVSVAAGEALWARPWQL